MTELDPERHPRPPPNGGNHMRKRGFVGIGVEPEASGGDAALGHHRGRFEKQQPRAALRQAPQMDKMPVAGAALACRILAHRRDHDPIFKREAAQADRREQQAHWHSLPQQRGGYKEERARKTRRGFAPSSRDW